MNTNLRVPVEFCISLQVSGFLSSEYKNKPQYKLECEYNSIPVGCVYPSTAHLSYLFNVTVVIYSF